MAGGIPRSVSETPQPVKWIVREQEEEAEMYLARAENMATKLGTCDYDASLLIGHFILKLLALASQRKEDSMFRIRPSLREIRASLPSFIPSFLVSLKLRSPTLPGEMLQLMVLYEHFPG